MSDLTDELSATERREIEHISTQHAQGYGLNEPVSLHHMSMALLRAHLILIRDCGDILPGKGRSGSPRRIRGKGGISLGGGC